MVNIFNYLTWREIKTYITIVSLPLLAVYLFLVSTDFLGISLPATRKNTYGGEKSSSNLFQNAMGSFDGKIANFLVFILNYR